MAQVRRLKLITLETRRSIAGPFLVAFVAMFSIFGPLGFTNLAHAQKNSDFSDSQIEFFENRIRPILTEHCLECHGEDTKKLRGGLQLTSRKLMLQGGDSGPVMVPGKPNESLLIQSVHYEEFEMPPKGKLNDSQIGYLEKWIEMGAPDPRISHAADTAPTSYAIDIQAGKQFWSFKRRTNVTPPHSSQADHWSSAWPRTPIDQFIARQLNKAGIAPVADANRETLIRRAYVTLIGLPPTIAQIDAFINDQQELPIAFAKVVDQLLDSKHFGERWGRHWLDVARFAESSGGGRSLMFKDAWRFRDYVINSYNADKPFDQFIKEQIAGDLLPYDSHAQKIEQLTGTGFLALGPTNYEQQDKELLKMEVVDEQVDTVGRAFLGLTLGCARCHDHKFDPIPMSDYYALAGIFKSTKSLVDGNVSKYVEQPLETEDEILQRKRYLEQVAKLTKAHRKADEKLRLLTGQKPQAKTKVETIVKSENLPGIVIDNRDAELIGDWKQSVFLKTYVNDGYIHDQEMNKGQKKVIFTPKFKVGGQYEVRMSYNSGVGRASNVPVFIDHQDGKSKVMVNQTVKPPINNIFVSLGTFRFEADNQSSVTVETTDTDGYVIVDAVQLLKVDSKDNNSKNKSQSDSKEPTKKPLGIVNANSGLDATQDKVRRLTQAERSQVSKLQDEIGELYSQLEQLKKEPPKQSAVAMSVKESAKPTDGHIHIRGSVRNLGPIVKRGFISVCCENGPTAKLEAKESGRLQLAQWIANPDHPLTARVYVNRVWRHLFGMGLVESTDNFGKVGRAPSHPELLDYLANQFVENDWSTKKLIRQIMLSRVYQLSSDFSQSAHDSDQRNRLLWRANRRRVDAEVLRDSILFVSGQLDLKPGGLTIRKISQYDLAYKFDTVRRSVYVPAFRNSMLDLFEVFDFANPNLVVGHRNTSTLPTQALFLMNSPEVMANAKASAQRLIADSTTNNKDRLVLVYRRMFGRNPSEHELKRGLDYLGNFTRDSEEPNGKREQANPLGQEPNLEAWTSLCHSLLASLDFRYIE